MVVCCLANLGVFKEHIICLFFQRDVWLICFCHLDFLICSSCFSWIFDDFVAFLFWGTLRDDAVCLS